MEKTIIAAQNFIYYINKKGKPCFVMLSTFERDVLKGVYYEHHTALTRGYNTVKHLTAERYNGRFGIGWKIYENNPNSTQYKIVHYIIKKEV